MYRRKGTEESVQKKVYRRKGTEERVQKKGYRRKGTEERVQKKGYTVFVIYKLLSVITSLLIFAFFHNSLIIHAL